MTLRISWRRCYMSVVFCGLMGFTASKLGRSKTQLVARKPVGGNISIGQKRFPFGRLADDDEPPRVGVLRSSTFVCIFIYFNGFSFVHLTSPALPLFIHCFVVSWNVWGGEGASDVPSPFLGKNEEEREGSKTWRREVQSSSSRHRRKVRCAAVMSCVHQRQQLKYGDENWGNAEKQLTRFYSLSFSILFFCFH